MVDSVALQLVCPHCGVVNRVPAGKLGDSPICGRCKSGLITGEPLIASDQTLRRIIEQSSLPVVVDFWAPWCGPCQSFAPVFSQVATAMATSASFVKLDTEANPQMAMQFQIRSIPTLAVFHNGRETARLAGALPKAQFVQWLQQQLPRRG